MHGKSFHLIGVVFITFSLLLGMFIIVPDRVSAETWFDHFDGPNGFVFDPRWTIIGSDIGIQDGITYFDYYDFDTGINTSWHGPSIRASVAPCGDFNISAILYCSTGSGEIFLGRADVRLLNPSGEQVFAFGWEDGTRVDSLARVWLRGSTDSNVIFDTGLSDDYSLFTTKEIRLVRSNGIITFYIEGNEQFSGDAGRTNIGFVELMLLKYGGEADCPPENMKFDQISVSTVPSTIPDAPQNLVCVPAPSSANLTWTAPTDDGDAPIYGYKIYRGTESGTTPYLTTIGPQTTYLDTGLINGLTYYYRVSALNIVGESQASAESSVTPISVPGLPSGFQVVGGNTRANLSWNPPLDDGGSAITGYRVYRTLNNVTVLVTETTGLSFSETGLINEITYYYSVSAVNSIGEGATSLPVLVVPGSMLTVPTVPRNLVTVGGDEQITLTWEPPESNGNTLILNYTIYRGETIASITEHAIVSAVSTYVDIDVVNGIPYYYKVSAINEIGEGPITDIAACTAEASLPLTAPTILSATASERQAIVTWLPPEHDGGSSVTGYRLYRSTSQGNLSFLVELGLALSYTDSELAWNTTYGYSISALNSMGEGPQSIKMNVTTMEDPAVQNDTTTSPDTWWDNFNLTSSIVTVLSLAIGLGIAYLFMRGGGEKATSIESPDKGVDDSPPLDDTTEKNTGNEDSVLSDSSALSENDV